MTNPEELDSADTDGYVKRADLSVGPDLASFVEDEALPGVMLSADAFWSGVSEIIHDLAPRNAELLEVRASMQAAIDRWHREHQDQPHDAAAYRTFLEELGYLVPQGEPFEIDTENVDPEIATIAGPQLVVPITNARYAINAANARWGSLYDAFYGTDALGDLPPSGDYDTERGDQVIARVRAFLDETIPLAQGSHADAVAYRIDGTVGVGGPGLAVAVDLRNDTTTSPADMALAVGYTGNPDAPDKIMFEHHGLGVEIIIDRDHPIGKTDSAGIADVKLESAVTAIMDCEDSIAAVDANDKALAYHNWLGLMQGSLTEEVTKDGETFTRTLVADRTIIGRDGESVLRPGRALLLIRNVGHLMTTPAVLDRNGQPVPEGLLDGIMTTLCAVHDLTMGSSNPYRNSRTGSVYVVKPKMHGPEEVAFTDELFTRVEELLGLPANTVKLGIMDEERRTTLNLSECIRAAKSRVAFINTGFLDRTGDEIHTSMTAGPMVRKADMKSQPWIGAYEDHNVDIGLTCGLRGRAQIGKGMWAAPDLMADMLDQKSNHPLAGANCAWVPSPTAATLHAIHYHQIDVAQRQAELVASLDANGPRASLDDLMTIPLAIDANWSDTDIQGELDNNAQGILGYVVRWVDQGIGCSKVPDINDVGLMEDRATCRISSQHMANWLHHGVVDADRVRATMEKMAAIVDGQNADDPDYQAMGPSFDGPAFRAALDLVLSGVEQPSGYTEPILHARRLEAKREAEHSRTSSDATQTAAESVEE